ncbi:protein amnionless [Hypomesus transpacificus]|uniref:protein amnionless n=1 Tax=Hypomesus transpacificus TaxID=137520 RepID=UPI001F0822FC|nr:protein amnionless [Hypomesus transpacificus]
MLKIPDILLLLCALGAADAVYKQWIPDTNYENETNWDKGSVPSGSDRVQFSASSKVSVYVETVHSVQEMRLPVDGEFILTSGAGFSVGAGGYKPGAVVKFKDVESLQWFDPALWQAASTVEDLEKGRFLFSVHEESVPCRHDDVVFKAHSSFRVDLSSNQPSVPVQSVSVLGKTFRSNSEFSQYLDSPSGRLQFHGSSSISLGSSGCSDVSGCECGNAASLEKICGHVECSSVTCKKPLRPVGNCCDVCGAIVTLQYVPGFNLETYRQRLIHIFLGLTPYKSIQLGISKVEKSRWFLGVFPRQGAAEIQIVLMDGETGHQAGMVAEALARDILKDAQSAGSNLGIAEAEFQASSGSSSSHGSGRDTGMVLGTIFGVLIGVGGVFLLVFLYYRGTIKVPSLPTITMPSLSSLKRSSEIGDLGGPMDNGFDNPMFDKPTVMPAVPGLYGAETTNSISLTQSGVHFVNPAYDDSETDFNA